MNRFAHHPDATPAVIATWSRKTTLAAYFADYGARQVWTPQSARAVDLAARTFPSADMPLRDLRRAHIETWIRAMHDAELAPATIRTRVANIRAILYGAMRDGIITEKHVVFASLAKMQINTGFATAAVVGGWASNVHFRPGEFNFLREVKRSGLDAALKASDEHFRDSEET